MKPINLKLFLRLSLLIIFFFVQYKFFFANHSHSFSFGDEGEHLTLGWEMATHQKKLYTDLSTNHQPIPFFTSFALFKLEPFTNLFMLFQRTRQFMFALSFIAALAFTLRFKTKGLITVVLIESLKFYFFGFHLLGESLALYPALFISALTFTQLLKSKSTKSHQPLDAIIFAISSFICLFSLLSTIPFVVICSFFYFKNQSKPIFIKALLSLAALTAILFIFINPIAWLEESVSNIYKYFLPHETDNDSLLSNLKIISYPFQSYLNLHSLVARYYAVALSAIMAMFFILKKKRSAFLIIYLILISLNLRQPHIDIGFYTAFHVLLQAAAITSAVIFLSPYLLARVPKSTKKYYLLSFCVILIILLTISTSWWRETKDKQNEFFIQYGQAEAIGSALKTIKKPQDTLLSSAAYINITSNLPLATRQNIYLHWSYRAPKIRNEFQALVKSSPPTFIYMPISGNPYSVYLQPILDKNYTRILRTDSTPTYLYILNRAIEKIDQTQWSNFENLYFQKPKNRQPTNYY